MDAERLERQIQFLIEIDKLKKIYRQTILMDGSRYENDAEHSWHLGVMAILLSEYVPEGDIDILKVIKMVLIHDIIEIDAGDTFCYDDNALNDKQEREQEFEERATVEARFAAALDRLQPLLHNYHTKGHSWQKHGVTRDKVIERNKAIGDVCAVLWNFAKGLIDRAVEKGFLMP